MKKSWQLLLSSGSSFLLSSDLEGKKEGGKEGGRERGGKRDGRREGRREQTGGWREGGWVLFLNTEQLK